MVESIDLIKWKCSICKGFILVDHSKIKNGEPVQFVFRRINKNDSIYFIYKVGFVVDRKGKLLIIKYKTRLYKVLENDAYPVKAPNRLIYNMFWTCGC
ncbi:hypothetical protein [Acinetobacter baumannii]|uniref:hypothetical protein n=1 Tax=Acinetobacter baumannii TaxID=470 RepID=UPI001057C5F6|nr:hypothetical protein [Acinetobacter baumannii]MDC4422858.1 hypothetical protein [Acinetobacter baumannii]MDC4567363.1 hypothetical protein [Acinetobacter baumannii]MDC4743042.1 hypothetical protein [Acinetobacter baumannii]MDC4854743.1 hypothetical protein [Acinetobacter baumannii]MDC4955881.1 hypothetical protein [Acinetobacter baumannii]